MGDHALLNALVASGLGRLGRGVAACAASSLLLLVARAGRADELAPILLSYRADSGCPEVADFQRRVESRSSQVHFVDEGTHGRELSIRLSRQGDSVRGELRLVEADGSLRQRAVRFTSCAEAVEGMALITAVSLDPHAQLQPPPRASSPVAEPAAKPAPTTLAAPVATSRPSSKSRPMPAPARDLELALGAEFDTAIRLLPAAPLGGGIFLDLGSAKRAWFAPLVRLAVSHMQRRSIAEPGVDANFALTLATLSGCPVKLETVSWVLRPCLFASGGVLRAWGSNTPDPHRDQSAFAAWGASALMGIRLTSRVELAVTLAGGSTLLRNSYVFDRQPLWSTPALYLGGGFGIRFRIE